ncbi:MAG: O-antigen ligase family protein [Cyclobacteriaceae bacterium]
MIKTKRIDYKFAALFLTLLLGSLFIGILIGTYGYKMGVPIIAALVGLPLIYKSVIDTEFGLYLFTWYTYFLFLIGRLLLPTRLPMGVGVEILLLVLSGGVIISEIQHKKSGWKFLDNPVTYIFIVYETYNVLQAFNPNATSLAGWLVSTRGIVFEMIAYLLLIKLFSNFSLIKNFTKLWMFLSLLAALYGFYQEIFGYNSYEWMDIYSNPQTIFLIQNWAFLRKFSFMSDVATFGIVMAYSGIFCGVLAMTSSFNGKKRMILGASAILMIIAMSFSGTRTATAMVPAGAFMYILMHINNRKTLIALVFLVVCGLAILYGPFYGTSISRIRTTFQPSQDPSMNVREYNRARAQPYIHSHPIGGGVNTTDSEGELLSPGHQLAGFPTDSGFLKTALTIGWIGLIIQMALYLSVIVIGVSNFYKARDPVIKALYGAYIAAFFSLIIANYAQPAMGQKPTGLIVFSIFVLMPNLIKFDSIVELKKSNKL